MEGIFINGAPLPMISCGLVNYGHSGLDYGSGAPASPLEACEDTVEISLSKADETNCKD